jgi:hypothetical protein
MSLMLIMRGVAPAPDVGSKGSYGVMGVVVVGRKYPPIAELGRAYCGQRLMNGDSHITAQVTDR